MLWRQPYFYTNGEKEFLDPPRPYDDLPTTPLEYYHPDANKLTSREKDESM